MDTKFLSLTLAAAATLFAASGVSAQKNVRFEIRESQARVLDVYPSTYVKPVVAELTVNSQAGRVRDTFQLDSDELAARSIRNDNDKLDYDATLQNLRVFAAYKSAEKHNCDVIIAATFDVCITERGAEISIVGYPANFTKWQTGTVADYDWIRHETGQLVPRESAVEKTNPKK